jgi:hypothetical protein
MNTMVEISRIQKRHHRQAVSDKELNKRSHEHRHRGFGWDNNDKPGVQLTSSL